MSLAPVPTEQDRALCANCSAPLAPDQRYCLACGQPASPVRLAFLDVLQGDARLGNGSAPVGVLPAGYASYGPPLEPASGPENWLKRYSGLFGLLTVLLLSIVMGLLVGHWVTESKAPSGPQVVKVEGLGALAAPAASTTGAAGSSSAAGTTPKATTAAAASAAQEAKVSAKTEAKEATEAKAIEKAPAPKAVKVTSTKLQKLGHTTGKKHEEEINSLGAQPIETGG